jgi:hypothetical protein
MVSLSLREKLPFLCHMELGGHLGLNENGIKVENVKFHIKNYT